MSGCSECGRTPLEAHGLCAMHYKRLWRDRKRGGPSTLWRRDELLAEVRQLLRDDCPERIAERLGLSLAAIEKAAYRSECTDVARLFSAAAKRARRAGRAVGQSVGVA